MSVDSSNLENDQIPYNILGSNTIYRAASEANYKKINFSYHFCIKCNQAKDTYLSMLKFQYPSDKPKQNPYPF